MNAVSIQKDELILWDNGIIKQKIVFQDGAPKFVYEQYQNLTKWGKSPFEDALRDINGDTKNDSAV